MATEVNKVCDIDRAADATTGRWTDMETGEIWEIDLCPKHRESATLKQVRDKGRPVIGKDGGSVKDISVRTLSSRIRG